MDTYIDLSVTRSRAEFHDAFAEALSLPGWYGRNLEDLYDCLTVISQHTHLHLLCWDSLEIALGSYTDSAREILLRAASVNPLFSVTFE